MTGNHFFDVSIPVPVLAAGYELPPAPEWQRHYWHCRPEPEMFSEAFLDWLESKGMKPRTWISPILFYAFQNGCTSVHKDIGNENLWAMNIILGQGAVEMKWHAPNVIGDKREVDLQYFTYPAESRIVEQTMLTGATVCKISTPHSSINYGPGVWVLSLRMAPVNHRFNFLKALFA